MDSTKKAKVWAEYGAAYSDYIKTGNNSSPREVEMAARERLIAARKAIKNLEEDEAYACAHHAMTGE